MTRSQSHKECSYSANSMFEGPEAGMIKWHNLRNFHSGWRDRYANKLPQLHKVTGDLLATWTKWADQRRKVLKAKCPGTDQEDFSEEEVSELSLEEQVDLARAGETQNVRRPGGTSGIDFPRATSSPIYQELQEGGVVQQKAKQKQVKEANHQVP